MNINRKCCTKIALILLGFSPLFWNSNPAHALTGSLNLNNENFTSDGGPLDIDAPGTSTINTTSTPNGFGGHFSSTGGDTFLLLGGNDATKTIPNTRENANSYAYSEVFTLTAGNIASDSLKFTFDWAFQGNVEALGSDSFEVFIYDSALTTPTSIFKQTTFGQAYAQEETVDISGFAPGDYVFYVTLNENTGNGNTAAGFDNISVAAVPFEFSPGLGLLIVGGLFGGHTYLKRRKLATNVKLN